MVEEYSTLSIQILCRGSIQDGLGHVIRSRTVALELAKLCHVEIHVIGDHTIDALLSSFSIPYTVHKTDKDAHRTLIKKAYDILVFDLISLEKSMFFNLSENIVTVSLSPIFNCLHHVDVFFNRTKYLDGDFRHDFNATTTVLAGLQYSIIRENCNKISTEKYMENLHKDPLSIAISMGGADASNKTLKALQQLKSIKAPLLIWALLGEGYGHSYRDLVDAVARDSNHEIILAKTNNSMWRIMESCSLVLLAGGTVSYEAAFVGIPSLNVFESHEHTFLTKELDEHGASISLGYPIEEALQCARDKIAYLDKHRDQLLKVHENCQDLIPYGGKERVAKGILDYYYRITTGSTTNTLMRKVNI